MAFALVFLIVLSVILILGAFLISKSDLPENDKNISIIAILALLALVSIVNEAKKTSAVGGGVGDIKLNLAELEKAFFTPQKNLDIEYRYQLPLLNDFKDLVSSTLGEFELENPKSMGFLLLEGDSTVGKTLAFKEYVRTLQTEKIPALYIDLKGVGSSVFQLANHLKLSSLSVLEDLIEKFNKNDRTPTLVFDHFESVFNEGDAAEASKLCTFLKQLFDSKKVNIILITCNSDIKVKLRSDEGISRRLTVKEFKKRSFESLEKYLIDKYNPSVIKEADKKFNSENIQHLLKTVGFSWNVLNSYKVKLNEVKNVQDFCKDFVNRLSAKIQERTDERNVYKALLEAIWDPEAKKYVNHDVAYSLIKKDLTDKQLTNKVREGAKDGFLKIGHGTVAFANNAVLNAVIRLEKPNYSEEL